MPVPTSEIVSATLQDVLQERLQGGGSFKQIESYLASQKTKNGRSMNCTPSIMTDMTAILQQEAKSHNFANIKTLLCCIQHLANEPSNDLGLPVLLENGLFDLLEYTYNIVMEQKCSNTHTSAPPSAVDACFIQLLETMNDVADHNSSTKEQISQVFAEKLMAFIVNSQGHFSTRMEAIRTLNLLLEGCSSQCLSDLRNNQVENLLKEFAEFLARAGDFEMQVACTETLARFIKKSEREAFSEKCFPNKAVAGSFLNIRDACFEVDCRKFLNAVNESQSNGRGVFSLPCVKAFLGQYKLKCPQDDNLIDFWVDFNSVSRSITIYVAEEGGISEDSGMWETVTLQEDQVRHVDIKKFGDLQHLNISLTVPVCQILPFCRSNSQAALIIFQPHHDLLLPLTSCYGAEKMLAQNKVRRKSSECTIKVLFSRMGEDGAIRTENFYGRSSAEDKTSYKKESAQSRSCAVPVRTKISAPMNPMTSPPRQSSKDRGNSSSHITRKPADSTPKTLKQQPSKRVKTPLNVSVSDKPSSTGGNDEERIKTGTSKEKESAGLTTASRSESPSQSRVERDLGDGDLSDGDDGITMEGCKASESKEEGSRKSGGETERKSEENSMKSSKASHERVLSSKENAFPSDRVQRTYEEGQIPSTSQIVPESQYSQIVVEETQDRDVPDSHQASESPLGSSQSASQGRRKGRRRRRQQARRSAGDQRKKRKSPRLQALEEMSALHPGKEKRSKSGKFRLYSESEGLVRDIVTPGDIIPSSCPSQDSMADFVPDSYPVTKSRKKEKSTRRKSSSSPSLTDIPEKPTESTDSSEIENKRRGQTKPRRRRSSKAKAASSKKQQKSKKMIREENEDETSSVSSTLHQTREFLSQSLPVLPPNDNYNEDDDPYLFSDINDGSAKVKDTSKKDEKEKVIKVTKHKKNLNKPDKSSFLNKKSFMSFPSKSLTLPVVDSEPGRNKGLTQSMMGDKAGDVDGTGDGHIARIKKEEAERSGQRVKGNRRGRGCKKMEGQPSVSSDMKGRQGKKGESKKRHDAGFEEDITSSEKEKLKGKSKERKLFSDEDHHMNREILESSDEKERGSKKGDKDGNSSGKISNADTSFASREMRELSDVEVMRDAAHLEEDFQDDDIHGLIQSVKKFLERPREDVTGKPSHGGSSSRKEVSLKKREEDGESLQEKEIGRERVRKDRSRERPQSPVGKNVEGDNRQEAHDIDGMEREAEKLEEGKEFASEMSFSDDGDAMEEINKELRALSKELQETGKRKKQHQQWLSEKYEETLTGESKKKGEKDILKTPAGSSRYGSDIEDEDEVESNLSLDFDDKKTEASVQSFSRICKSIVCQSGDGIAKNRSRRDLPKVDYRNQDVSFSDEDYVPSLDAQPLNMSSDSQDDRNEGGYTSNTSRRTSGFTDLQSERSWLVEKSHIKVSTYSKVQRKRWAKERQGEDVFKTIKKGSQRKQTESQKRSASPENVALEVFAPKKKKKKTTEDDGAIDFLYYRQDSQQSHPASQERLIQKVSSIVQREDQGVTPSSSHTSKSSGKAKVQATLVTPRSSLTSKSSKKTKIQDVASNHDGATNDLIEPFSQDVMMELQMTPGCGMTPQVKIGEDEETQSDGDDPDARQSLLSGPSKMSTLTQSFLKRKYEHMIEDITRSDDENNPGEDSLEEEDAAEIDEEFKPPMVRRSINPRRLFENELLAQGNAGLHESVQADGDTTSGTSSSSSSNLSWKHPSDFHIPEMVAIVGQKIQRQFAEKRNQTRALTDSVLKSTQKYLSKIWAEQNHGRQAALEEFRDSLLKEIVALEIDIENLNKTSSKLQAMAQRRLKTGVEMNSRHAMHIRSLHQSYIQELNEMDLYLEENLKKSVKTIVEQEFGSLKNKLLNDLHAQDVSQMKRALQSYFSL